MIINNCMTEITNFTCTTLKSSDFCPVKLNVAISLFICLSSIISMSQKPLENKCYSEGLSAIQVYPSDNPLGYPLIGLGSGESLEFHFDEMSTELNSYNYGVIHCSHDWQPSDLESNEYLQGFQFQGISQFEAGFNTMYEYVHHQFTFPNDMSKPRYSGNYLMIVFRGQDINDRSNWMITYRFMIYENAVSILSNVGRSSIIAERYTKQEVDFDISYKDFTIYDPMREINVSILQNFDWENEVGGLKPIFLKPEILTFDYSMGENNLEAGSEWRNFEVKNIRYTSSEVEAIMREPDGYHVYLRPDIPEGKKAYATWPDLNGNYLIKNDEADNSNIEAEYVTLHFKLNMPEISESEVLIEGKFQMFNKQPLKCTYDKQQGAYIGTALMKQGYYNYRYVVRDLYQAQDNLRYTEGSYSSTENDYHIIVYMYDRNLPCDRIIAVKADNSVK